MENEEQSPANKEQPSAQMREGKAEGEYYKDRKEHHEKGGTKEE